MNWIINREFSFFLAARILFSSGMKMVPVCLGWFIYEKTNSPFALGMLGLCEVVPAVLFALPAGVKVDTSYKRTLILKLLISYLLIVVLLGIITNDSILLLKENSIVFICILVAVTGFLRAYLSPALSAIIAQLVPKEDLVQAASYNSMSWLIAAMIGPSIAGLCLGYLSISAVFILMIIFMVSAFICIYIIAEKPISFESKNAKRWESVKEGIDFVIGQKALLGAMTLDMFAVLFGGVVAMLPIYAKDILQVGPQGFGILMSATYLGNFLAIFYLTKRPIQNKQGYSLIYSVGGFGVCILVFALSKSFIISAFALLMSGVFDGISVIIRSTIFQILVPDHMRGRVSSVNSIFVNSSNELGQFESGVAASIFGTIPSVVFGGIMTLMVSLFSYKKFGALRKLEY